MPTVPLPTERESIAPGKLDQISVLTAARAQVVAELVYNSQSREWGEEDEGGRAQMSHSERIKCQHHEKMMNPSRRGVASQG